MCLHNTTKFIILHTNMEANAARIQLWMRENRIKHKPTIKTGVGWKFEIYDENYYSTAFKIMWANIIRSTEK